MVTVGMEKNETISDMRTGPCVYDTSMFNAPDRPLITARKHTRPLRIVSELTEPEEVLFRSSTSRLSHSSTSSPLLYCVAPNNLLNNAAHVFKAPGRSGLDSHCLNLELRMKDLSRDVSNSP